jgi:hypothetical protein
MAAWTVSECERCFGFGLLPCLTCERSCDHDRLCPDCKGYGWRPVKVTDPMGLLMLASADKYLWGPWNTRREAFATIEYDSLA